MSTAHGCPARVQHGGQAWLVCGAATVRGLHRQIGHGDGRSYDIQPAAAAAASATASLQVATPSASRCCQARAAGREVRCRAGHCHAMPVPSMPLTATPPTLHRDGARRRWPSRSLDHDEREQLAGVRERAEVRVSLCDRGCTGLVAADPTPRRGRGQRGSDCGLTECSCRQRSWDLAGCGSVSRRSLQR